MLDIYGLRIYIIGTKDGNVLFNDALNTFYLWLYGIIYMVKDHSDSERKLFYMHHPTDRMTHTTAFVTPVMEHWLERIYNSVTHLRHNILCIRKEENALFNDALNIFYLRLYGIGHMVKDIQTAREETCCCHFILCINSIC